MPAPALALSKRAILANEQVQMFALLVGKLEEDCLPSDSSNRSPYLLKNRCEPRSHLMPMRRPAIVDARRRALGTVGEESVGGAFEEEKRGSRFEMRILLGSSR